MSHDPAKLDRASQAPHVPGNNSKSVVDISHTSKCVAVKKVCGNHVYKKMNSCRKRGRHI